MMDFTTTDVECKLRWVTVRLFSVPTIDTEERVQREHAAETQSEEAATESMRRVQLEIARAANVLVANGFAEPLGREFVSDDQLAILNWNRSYADAAKQWIESDPDWKLIGGAARCASQLLDACVGIQIAMRSLRNGTAPITTAVALHNMSVVFGAMRIHLNQWLEGAPQKLAAQRSRGAGLKSAKWLNPLTDQIIRDGLVLGDKVEAIVSDVLAQLATDNELLGPDLPTRDAVRMKIQRIKGSHPT